MNAATQVHLNFKSGGKLAAVMVQTGQQVAAGDLLAKLDDGDAKVALQQAQSNLNAAQAKYNSTVSGSDLVPLRASVDQAQQALNRLQANYNAAKSNLDVYFLSGNNDRGGANLSFIQSQATLSTLQGDLVADTQYGDVRTATTTANTIGANFQQAQVQSTSLDQAITDLSSSISLLKIQVGAADVAVGA